MRKVKASRVKKEPGSETTGMVAAMESEEPKQATVKVSDEIPEEKPVERKEETPATQVSVQAPSQTSPAPSTITQRDKLSVYLSAFLQKVGHSRHEDRFSESESQRRSPSPDEDKAISERLREDFGGHPRKRVCAGEIKIPIIKIEPPRGAPPAMEEEPRSPGPVKEEADSITGERRRRSLRTSKGPTGSEISGSIAKFGGVFAPVTKREERSARDSSVSSVLSLIHI
eukprot:TRINITY_DN1636_c0_g1_i3.p1 TRINITY_DN1636_c0_g1~~TRINITY_DN1636_c0_g1_i3.p1  ORF type:complete len:228 (+),score=63.20 TRINITY_DN1636_c0_g1_i3:691-1374(+)